MKKITYLYLKGNSLLYSHEKAMGNLQGNSVDFKCYWNFMNNANHYKVEIQKCIKL